MSSRQGWFGIHVAASWAPLEPEVTHDPHRLRQRLDHRSGSDPAEREALTAAGCTVIREEKVSGTSTKGRTELATILDFITAGDTLVVTRIDRLARSIGDLQDIVRTLKAKGADLKATEQPIDTSTAAGKAFLDMLGVFAEFETNLRRERQLEGIAKAKAEGVYKGGTRRLDRETVRAMFVAGHPERRPIRLRPPRLPRIGPPLFGSARAPNKPVGSFA